MEILSYKVVTDGCEIRVCCGNGVNYLFFLSLFFVQLVMSMFIILYVYYSHTFP